MPSPAGSSSSIDARVAAAPGFATERFLSFLGFGVERFPSSYNRFAHALRRFSMRSTCAASFSTGSGRGPSHSGSEVHGTWLPCGNRQVPLWHHSPSGSSLLSRSCPFSARLTAAARAVAAASAALRFASFTSFVAVAEAADAAAARRGAPVVAGVAARPGVIAAAAANAANRGAPSGIAPASRRAFSISVSALPETISVHATSTASGSS